MDGQALFAGERHAATTLTKSTSERAYRYFSDLSLQPDNRKLDPPPTLPQKTFIL